MSTLFEPLAGETGPGRMSLAITLAPENLDATGHI